MRTLLLVAALGQQLGLDCKGEVRSFLADRAPVVGKIFRHFDVDFDRGFYASSADLPGTVSRISQVRPQAIVLKAEPLDSERIDLPTLIYRGRSVVNGNPSFLEGQCVETPFRDLAK